MTEWLTFANDKETFDVLKCFDNLKECHWRKYSFTKGDIVYLYVKSLERVKYKTVVVEDNVIANDWDDDPYWIDANENNDKQNRVVLRLLEISDGKLLSLNHLYANGLKTTRSLTRPNKNPKSLISYIRDQFPKYKDDDYFGEIDVPEESNNENIKKVYVNRYERDPEERRKCIERYGNKFECIVCGMSFEKIYGELGRDFIHVHHVNPLADNGKDVSANMIPVCPNCHAMLHRYLKEGSRNYCDLRKEINNLRKKKEL